MRFVWHTQRAFECHFSWQRQHLVLWDRHFWWNAQHLSMFECHFLGARNLWLFIGQRSRDTLGLLILQPQMCSRRVLGGVSCGMGGSDAASAISWLQLRGLASTSWKLHEKHHDCMGAGLIFYEAVFHRPSNHWCRSTLRGWPGLKIKRKAKQFFEHAGVGYGLIFSNSIEDDVVWLASWAAEVEGVRWCGGTCTRSLVPVAHLVLGATGDCVCLPAVTDENPRLPASGFDRYK